MPTDDEPGRHAWEEHAAEPCDYESLFKSNNTVLYQVLLHLTQDWAVAEEIRQETLVRAWQHWNVIQTLQEAQRRVWLLRTARRLVLDQARLNKRRANDPIPDLPDPVSSFTQLEDALDARQILRRLPDQHREVLVLYYLAGLNTVEISDVLHIQRSTVTSRLARARSALQRIAGEGAKG